MIGKLLCRLFWFDHVSATGNMIIPYAKTAFFCADCELITWTRGRCGACGSDAVTLLAAWLDRPAQGNIASDTGIQRHFAEAAQEVGDLRRLWEK